MTAKESPDGEELIVFILIGMLGIILFGCIFCKLCSGGKSMKYCDDVEAGRDNKSEQSGHGACADKWYCKQQCTIYINY